MKFTKALLSFVTISTLLFSNIAKATIYQFDISGDYTAKWQLDSSPLPNDITNGQAFIIWDVLGSFANASSQVVDLAFFNSSRGGGISIDDFQVGLNLLSSDGPQLYDGNETSPVFKLGTFVLTQYHGSGNYYLTIQEVASVPEPGIYLMLACGFMLIFLTKKNALVKF